MESNRAIPLLNQAAAGGYAIPAMCAYNTEGILATVRAAERKRSPAMILLFPWALEYAGGLLAQLAHTAARAATVPITVHLDHAQDAAQIRRAADTGFFDSIMVDMSHHDKAENLRRTRELTAYCHARAVATEAEPGRIEGGEDGVADTADLEGLLTTVADARDFVATGIDWLAPAFGNVHGSYGARGVVLEYGRLRAIRDAVGDQVRLVMHGCDPWTEEVHRSCIAAGAAKVNLNKVLNNPCVEVWKTEAGKAPLTRVIELATERMQEAVERSMDSLGSTGKA